MTEQFPKTDTSRRFGYVYWQLMLLERPEADHFFIPWIPQGGISTRPSWWFSLTINYIWQVLHRW